VLNKTLIFLLILMPMQVSALIGMNGYVGNIVSIARFKDIRINQHQLDLTVIPNSSFSPSAPVKVDHISPIVRSKVILNIENMSNAHNHIMLGLPISYADPAFSAGEKILKDLHPHLVIDGVKHKTKIIESPKSNHATVIKIVTLVIDLKPLEKKQVELSYDMYVSFWPIDLDDKNIEGIFGKEAIVGIAAFFAYAKIDSGYANIPGDIDVTCNLEGIKRFLSIKNEINQGYVDARSFNEMMHSHFKQNYNESSKFVDNSAVWKPWKFFDPFRYIYLNNFPKSNELLWKYQWRANNLNFGFEFEILDLPSQYDEFKLFYLYHNSKMTSSQFAHFRTELLKIYGLDLNNQYHLNDHDQISQIVEYLKWN